MIEIMTAGSPLCWAVRVDVCDEWRRGQRFCGEDPALQLDPKAHDGVADESDFRGLSVYYLPSQTKSG